jgi:hypothetical protein
MKIVSEINRMREIMGLRILSEVILERMLLTEGGPDDLGKAMGFSPKTYDNMTKQGVKFVDDLSTVSSKFDALGIKSFNDLKGKVQLENPAKTIDELTDEDILAYLKTKGIYDDIQLKASTVAKAEADMLTKNLDVVAVFKGNEETLKTINFVLGTKIDDLSIQGGLKEDLITYKTQTDNTISSLKNSGTPVPKSLEDLSAQLQAKIDDCTTFSSGKSTTPSPGPAPFPKPDEPTFKPEEPTWDGTTKIDEILNNPDIVGNIRKQYPNLTESQVKLVIDGIKTKYAGQTVDDIMKNMNQILSDFKTRLDQMQNMTGGGSRPPLPPIGPNRKPIDWSKAKVIYDNVLTRSCVGSTPGIGGKPTVQVRGWRTLGCLFFLYSLTELITWFSTPKMEREFILCMPLSNIGGLCQWMYDHGFCENACSGTGGGDLISKVYDDNLEGDRGFKKWCSDNSKNDCGKDPEGDYYYMKDGSKVYCEYLIGDKTFKEKASSDDDNKDDDNKDDDNKDDVPTDEYTNNGAGFAQWVTSKGGGLGTKYYWDESSSTGFVGEGEPGADGAYSNYKDLAYIDKKTGWQEKN